MTYRVIFGGGAAMHFHHLPEAARDAVLTRAVHLAEAPWDNATVLPPGDDPAFRETVFGAGNGLLSFHVAETEETVRIFNIVWIGQPGPRRVRLGGPPGVFRRPEQSVARR